MRHHAGLIGAAARRPDQDLDDLEEEFVVEESLTVESDEDSGDESFSNFDKSMVTASSSIALDSDSSPLAGKGRSTRPSHFILKDEDSIGDIGLFNDPLEEEAGSSQYTSATEDHDVQYGETTDGQTDPDVEGSEVGSKSENDRDFQNSSMSQSIPQSPVSPSPVPETVRKVKIPAVVASPVAPLNYKSGPRKSSLEVDDVAGEQVSFDSLLNQNDSVIIIPNKQARKVAMAQAGPNAVYGPRPGEVDDLPKKKKRILGKKTIVTEEEIDAVTDRVAKVGIDNKTGSVRRLTRGNKRPS